MSAAPIEATPRTTRPARTARTASRRARKTSTAIHIALIVIVTVGLLPYLFVLTTSVKSNEQFSSNYWVPTFPFHFENYLTAWNQISPFMAVSIVVAVISIAGIVLLSLVSGFVLARFQFPGRQFFFAMVIALLMVPGIASLIPLFVMMRDLGLLNTLWVLILPRVAGGAVLGTILMKTFIEGIPQELFDAARVDGAGTGRLFRSIMLPLSLPVVGTVSLLTVIGVWNDFFWPLLTVTNNALKPVSVGLLFFRGQAGTDYGAMFAGYMIASLPLLLLFLFLSKYFLAGIQGGLPGSH